LSNLQEAILKTGKIKLSDLEVSDIELTCKFRTPNPKVIKHQKNKKEKTIWEKLWLFIVKQSINATFQLFIKHFQQFIP